MARGNVSQIRIGKSQSPAYRHITKKNGKYFLHISIEFEVEKRETKTYLGIDRGIKKFAVITVVRQDGQILHNEQFSGREYETFQERMAEELKQGQKTGVVSFNRYARLNESFLHVIANRIVELADQFDSQVVLEDLTWLSKGGFKSKTGDKRLDRLLNRKLGRNPYNKLKRMLDYKLPVRGLPTCKLVPAFDTSITCPKCNHIAKENRSEQATFKCVNCGHEANADDNASINIARRGSWWQRGVLRKNGDLFIGKLGNRTITADSYRNAVRMLQEIVPLAESG